MLKKYTLFIMAILFLLFSGCSRRKIVLNNSGKNTSNLPENTWAREGNLDENIDVSDLDNSINSETPTVITKGATKEKMEWVRFPVEEYNKLSKIGKGTVRGRIYVKNAYNQKVFGSNTRLYLNPVTSYSKQWYNESYISGYKMKKADNRLFNYLRYTTSDTQGQFAFYGVPTGAYYLIGKVDCASECGYTVPKSIRIATRVNVKGNQIIQKDLSRLID